MLTEKGAWREETLVGHAEESPEKYDGVRYGGFYSQDGIKQVIAHADSLGITIVPEIEIPGHAIAALRAYPQYSCTGGPIAPFNKWGISEDAYCPGKEATFTFLEGILDEVVDLFPSKYIHIGGDECIKDRWKKCPDCQKRMKKEHLKNEGELQSYFVKRMESYLNSKGKKLIGWDEILEGGLPERASVMCWRDDKHAVAAANSGHNVVMTPNEIVYLDHYQAKENEPLAIGGLTTMNEIYSWPVMPEGITDESKSRILGAQCNMWTEYVPTNEHLEYMLYPRLVALAEKVWTLPGNQNYTGFLQRMNSHYQRLGKAGIHYRAPRADEME